MWHMRGEIKRWVAGMSRATRIGGIVLLLGLAVDLAYHGIIQPLFPLPESQQTLVAYAGHIITFAGMIIMLLSVAWEAWRITRQSRPTSPPDGISIRRH